MVRYHFIVELNVHRFQRINAQLRQFGGHSQIPAYFIWKSLLETHVPPEAVESIEQLHQEIER